MDSSGTRIELISGNCALHGRHSKQISSPFKQKTSLQLTFSALLA